MYSHYQSAHDIQIETKLLKLLQQLKYFIKIEHSEAHLKEWIKLFQATLCLDAWDNQDNFQKITTKNDSKVDIVIREYMKFYTKLVDHEVDNGNKIKKLLNVIYIILYKYMTHQNIVLVHLYNGLHG